MNISAEAIDLLISSIAESTLKQYIKPIGDWTRFCRLRKCDIFNPQIKDVIEWLTDKFTKGASYGTLNTCRSALSLITDDQHHPFRKASHHISSNARYFLQETLQA